MLLRFVNVILANLGFSLVRTKPAKARTKFGMTPGYHRLEKLPPIAMVIDVGVGPNGSPFLYKRFPHAFFVSIDPLEESGPIVARHIPESQSYFVNAAVGRSPGYVELDVSQTASRTSLYARTCHDDASHPVSTRRVTVRTLDDIMSDIKLQRPALLKIDTEGSELDCLTGGLVTLSAVDYIILELPLTDNFIGGYLLSDIVQLLARAGFEIFQVLKAGNNTLDALFCHANDPVRKTWSYGNRINE